MQGEIQRDGWRAYLDGNDFVNDPPLTRGGRGYINKMDMGGIRNVYKETRQGNF
jgi:hypothetical protein